MMATSDCAHLEQSVARVRTCYLVALLEPELPNLLIDSDSKGGCAARRLPATVHYCHYLRWYHAGKRTILVFSAACSLSLGFAAFLAYGDDRPATPIPRASSAAATP